MFEIGQKVVCIAKEWQDPNDYFARFGIECPKHGEVYTIRGFWDYGWGIIGLYLEEIRNPEIPTNGDTAMKEPTFHIEYFRPLVERKTDISIFQRIDADVFKRAPVGEHKALRLWVPCPAEES